MHKSASFFVAPRGTQPYILEKIKEDKNCKVLKISTSLLGFNSLICIKKTMFCYLVHF